MAEITKVSYGRPLLKKLTEQARRLGNNIGFYIDDSGKYVIRDGLEIHRPPTAAAACFFMKGVISSSKNQL
jgi:hypothetical protein